MQKTTKIILIRHASTQLNLENRYQGKLDLPLSKQGILEAKLLKKRITKLPTDIFFASPLKRVRQTLDIIIDGKNAEIIIHHNLREINFGLWEGLTRREIEDRYLDHLTKWETNPLINKPPQGESMNEVLKRAASFHLDVISKHQGKNIVVVSSAGLLNIFLCHLFKIKPRTVWPFQLASASVSEVLIHPDEKIALTLLNDTSHLKGD